MPTCFNIETVPSWQPQSLLSVPNSQGTIRDYIVNSNHMDVSGAGTQPLALVTNTNSEHRKKMAAAKDIWSSDSETEDEKY